MSSTPLVGIYGTAFQPYVGPWDAGGPVLFNTYTVDQVTQLLQAISPHFSLIATYGQGTFVWQGNPNIQDSNRLNIEAAKAVGLKVAAGCYQQISNNAINIPWTQVEIDYAIQQAKQCGNVVELIIGNECLVDVNSTQAIIQLINYAKTQRTAAGFTPETLPITTRQRWDVLGGINNTSPDYAPMQQALSQLLKTCEGFVYANMYAYFDPNIANQIGTNPTQAAFTQAVTISMNNTLAALKTAFSAQQLTTEIRIGETGWPTSGSQSGQPNGAIANVQNAQWYAQAMQSWATANAIKTILFEAYDEPWKAQGDANSETHFGLWQTIGTSSNQGQYTLTEVQQKVAIAA
jgi:exo-beta-1,3-glucanase (GH17 family)